MILPTSSTGTATERRRACITLAVDDGGGWTGRLMHGLVVTPASVQDRDMIGPMMSVVCRVCATIERCIADGGYQGAATAAEVMALAGIPLEIVKRSDVGSGFKVLPRAAQE